MYINCMLNYVQTETTIRVSKKSTYGNIICTYNYENFNLKTIYKYFFLKFCMFIMNQNEKSALF